MAIRSTDVDCIRYRGANPDVSRRLVEIGRATACDQISPVDAVPLTRSHVSFISTEQSNAVLMAEDFLRHFERQPSSPSNPYRTKSAVSGEERAVVEVSWYNEVYHIVEFESFGHGEWLAVTRPKFPEAWFGLSRLVDSWLRARGLFRDIRWFSAEQWKSGGPFRSTVV